MNKRKVFIVEDEDESFKILKKLLVSSGFEVDGVRESKGVMEKIKFFKPDIILMDLLMPGLGGFEMCQMLNDDKDTQGIPIIVMSALGGGEELKRAFALGAVDYFTKPYDFREVEKKINKFIEYKKTSSEE
ncbi:MAG: response regulator [Candidatus Omnitrophota bacterium]|nr:response regulator [Candidatus Omnitrophota bacterium]